MTDLGEGRATCINNSGQIAGGNDSGAFLYSGGSMHDLGTLLGASDSVAAAINDSGQIVGGAGGDAFIHSNGVMLDLNSLIAPGLGWTLVDATGINDLGQICGYGTNAAGQEDAFLLTPIPEPSTLALLGAAAIAFAGYAWRQRRTVSL